MSRQRRWRSWSQADDTNSRDYFIGRVKFLLTPSALPDLEADAAYLFMYSRTDVPRDPSLPLYNRNLSILPT